MDQSDTNPGPGKGETGSEPVAILVAPQLPENIGMSARALLNCGLRHLRLVAPREGWPDERSRATAADADEVIDAAEVFSSVGDAVADCHHVFATTARERGVNLPVLPVDEAAAGARARSRRGERVGILFGGEASGLDNAALTAASTLVRFPTNPDFPSLNLAQAVLLWGWEWRRTLEQSGKPLSRPEAPAPQDATAAFADRLDHVLEESGFFLTSDLRPATQRGIRALLQRAAPSDRELQLLHGMLTALRKS